MVTPCVVCHRLIPVGGRGRCAACEPVERQLRRTRAYRELRTAVMAASGGRCAVCGRVGGRLELGHRAPAALRPELALAPRNVEPQCPGCNARPGPLRGT